VNSSSSVPSVRELLWPTLRAVREIGDSGTIEEIVEKVIELEGFSEELQDVPHGDGTKGLLITTGSFTAAAKQEATRDGAPPIDLIDGEQLCELLRKYGLGVRDSVREVESTKVTPEFFADL
jgi:restriction endonuclease Mrr